MLTGILVDLVPYDKRFLELTPKWEMGPAGWWANGGDVALISKADHQRHVQEWIEHMDSGRDTGMAFGIQTKDGTPIGQMGINWMSPTHRFANLGALIGEPDYWGSGYGTDALTLLVEYCFNWLDLRKVWIGTMSVNVRVMRQMEKVGFTLEGRLRQMMYGSGEWYDDMNYGLLREEWPGREAVVERLGIRARE